MKTETTTFKQSNWIEYDNKLICLETGTIIKIKNFKYQRKASFLEKIYGCQDENINDYYLKINDNTIDTFTTKKEAQAEYDRLKKILIGE